MMIDERILIEQFVTDILHKQSATKILLKYNH